MFYAVFSARDIFHGRKQFGRIQSEIRICLDRVRIAGDQT